MKSGRLGCAFLPVCCVRAELARQCCGFWKTGRQSTKFLVLVVVKTTVYTLPYSLAILIARLAQSHRSLGVVSSPCILRQPLCALISAGPRLLTAAFLPFLPMPHLHSLFEQVIYIGGRGGGGAGNSTFCKIMMTKYYAARVIPDGMRMIKLHAHVVTRSMVDPSDFEMAGGVYFSRGHVHPPLLGLITFATCT